MKKSIFILMLVLSVLQQCYAQHKTKFGVHAGTTYSKEVGQDLPSDIDKAYAYNFIAGVSFDFYLTDQLSLKTYLSYEKKSSHYDIDTYDYFDEFDPSIQPIDNLEVKTTFTFITLPFVVKYDFKKENGFFIDAGPYVGLLLKMEEKISASGYPDQTDDYTDNFNDFDFGISAGVGKVFKIDERNDITIEIRDCLGLIPLNIYTSEYGFTKFNSISLTAGWSFDMK